MVSINDINKLFINFKELETLIPDTIFLTENKKLFDTLIKNISYIPKLSLLGKSGDGKSSLLNSILGIKNFLDTKAKGGAVTSCPCEMYYREEMAFELEYEDLDNITDYELKKSILDSKIDLTKEKFNCLWTRKLQILKDIFQTEKDIFNKKYPSNIISRDKKISKIIDYYKKGKEVPGKDYKLKILPMIKNIKVFIPCDILKIVTLVDLPGLNDSCQYRIQRSINYLENKTDFIALVNDCNRLSTDDFIDKNLNSYILNSIIRNNIKDVLIIGTKADYIYDGIKEEDSDDEDSDDEDSDGGDSDDEKINIKFNDRISDIKHSLERKIINNENLSLRGITNSDIHILITSKTFHKEKPELSGINSLITKIEEIINFRSVKIENTLYELIKKSYEGFKDYITRPYNEIEGENKDLIQQEFTELEEKIKSYYVIIKKDMKINNYIFSLTNTDSIKSKFEKQKKDFCSEIHGRTVTAVLQKLNHISSDNTEYIIKDNIIIEIQSAFLKYIKNNLSILSNIISEKRENKSNFIENSNLPQILEKIYVQNYNFSDIKNTEIDLDNMLKTIYESKNYTRDSLSNVVRNNSLELITDSVNELLEDYRNQALEHSGLGTANIIRDLFKELYTEGINKICNSLNKPLTDCFNEIIDLEQEYYNNEIEKTLEVLEKKYIKTKIDLTHITEKFEVLTHIYKGLNFNI